MHLPTNIREFCARKSIRITGVVIIALMVGALIFHAGVGFGERRAFDRMRTHGGHGMPPPPIGLFGIPLPHEFIPDGHGTVGKITAVASSTSFTLQARDGSTVTIDLLPDTQIMDDAPASTSSALVVGALVVVVGQPAQDSDAGQDIDARIIHVLPPNQP